MSASLVLSLDFEMRWGMLDKLGTDMSRYRRNLEGVRDVVPATLAWLASNAVNATWAVVGALACDDWEEHTARSPAWPAYRDPALLWNDAYAQGDPEGRLYFAPNLVRDIVAAPGQELASHTFNHVYKGAPGFMRRDAEADTVAMARVLEEKFGVHAKSLVFPRNEVAFTDVLAAHGITAYRDNPRPAFWSPSETMQRSYAAKALRLLDALVPIGRRVAEGGRAQRASHFVRWAFSPAAWKAHQRRIVNDAASLRDGDVLHLWWHPHNMGADPEGNLRRLDELYDAIVKASPVAIVSRTMGELAPEAAGAAA